RVQRGAAERLGQLPAAVVAGVDAVSGVVQHCDGQVHRATVAAQVDRQRGRDVQAALALVPAPASRVSAVSPSAANVPVTTVPEPGEALGGSVGSGPSPPSDGLTSHQPRPATTITAST